MKKWNPLLILFLLFIFYWVILFIVAITVDSQHAGGEQYFLTIFAKGIDFVSNNWNDFVGSYMFNI